MLTGLFVRRVSKVVSLHKTIAIFSFQANLTKRLLHLSSSLDALQIKEIRTYDEVNQHFAEPPLFSIMEFYDEANGPCQMQCSRVRNTLGCWDIDIDLLRVDVMSAAELVEYFQVQSVPTLITFHREEPVDREDELIDDERLDELIETLIVLSNEDEQE
jgi:thioredoxin-like negative regulator of GroEL